MAKESKSSLQEFFGDTPFVEKSGENRASMEEFFGKADKAVQPEVEPEKQETWFERAKAAIQPTPESKLGQIPRRDIGKDIIETAVGVGTGMTGGLVQSAAEATVKKITGESIEDITGKKLSRGNLVGQIGGAITPVGLTSKAANVAAKIVGGASEAKTAFGVARKVAGYTAAGVVGGGLFPADELQDRIINAALGGALSGTGGAIYQGAKVLNESFGAVKKIKDLTKQISNIELTKLGKVEKLERLKMAVKESGEEAVQLEKKRVAFQNQQIANAFAREASETATRFRPEIMTKVVKAPSKAYEETLEVMIENAEKMQKSGNVNAGITIDDFLSLEKETLDELSGMGLDLPQVRTAIAKSTEGVVGKISKTPTTDMLGLPIKRNEFVNLEEVLKQKKLLKNSLSSKATEGSGKFTPEDLAISIYNKNLGKRLGPVLKDSSGFDINQLNQQYAQAVKLQKFAFKNFRPGTGEFDTKAANTFMKNLGLKPRSLTREDFLAMSNIEDGIGLVEGTGRQTTGVRQLGKQVQRINLVGKERIAQVESTLNNRLRLIDKQLYNTKTSDKKMLAQLRYEKANLEQMQAAAHLVKRVGAAAGFAIVQGAAAMAFYRMIVND